MKIKISDSKHWKEKAVQYNHERERIYKEMSNVSLTVLSEILKINGCAHIMDYCDLMARKAVFGGLNA